MRAPRSGFTLFELLAVVGLMAAALAVAVAGWRGSGSSTARDGAVALLGSRVAAARALAIARGEPVRLCVHADPTQPERYLRYLVIAVPDGAGWRAPEDGSVLPAGLLVLPPDALPTIGPGAVRRAEDDWSRGSGGALRSTALRMPAAAEGGWTLEGTSAWLVVHFSATGGVQPGALVVAAARRADETLPATLVCSNSDDVAGLSLSSYGVATWSRGRADF